ncbi:NAD(P)-dependent dehydrogenase (short-subunit alcohol dehydrogenase family) [Catenuloplanes nepalensis]|uniref:NAD(P)-dependent dehydrogenase (Short-subunit alcohol dehydrogenase family) n=1 Tax=Catenuloplanes nepalensis TaxID=587533 RepID=A0ABT9MUH1_9ACTN|nr:SDR family NAD(P)-dependent oxidoreductase [Catenuloplanes nepalensis]MDP9795092.1 NAD(P)-dependent dehydrogenase (short-subunit alcohol dehydrogenase family) [Catenuloplanes nepalensis]
MSTNRIALVTGANQGMGKQIARELAADGLTVFVGSRDLVRGEAAAAEIGGDATALQLDVTDATSIAAAAERIRAEAGRLDVLINNAAISTTRAGERDLAGMIASAKPSRASLDEVRAVWEVNVFGPLAVYQAMLPLLRRSPDARIVNVSSAVASLTLVADPAMSFHATYEPVYAASKTGLNAMTMAMMIELEETDIKVNLVSPGFAKTALVNFEGTDSVEDSVREVVRVARLGPSGPAGTFTTWEGQPLPW